MNFDYFFLTIYTFMFLQLQLPYSTYLKKLSTLRLMNNTIHEFRDIQSSLYNSLKYLDLSFNRLTKIQGKIKYISSEKYIFLIQNKHISVQVQHISKQKQYVSVIN